MRQQVGTELSQCASLNENRLQLVILRFYNWRLLPPTTQQWLNTRQVTAAQIHIQFTNATRGHHNKSNTVDGCHIENRFLAISRHHDAKFGGQKHNMQTCYTTRITNFENLKLGDCPNFENVIPDYFSRKLSWYEEIYYADSHFDAENSHLTIFKST